MSPNDPEPIFRPMRNLPPTLSSILLLLLHKTINLFQITPYQYEEAIKNHRCLKVNFLGVLQ